MPYCAAASCSAVGPCRSSDPAGGHRPPFRSAGSGRRRVGGPFGLHRSASRACSGSAVPPSGSDSRRKEPTKGTALATNQAGTCTQATVERWPRGCTAGAGAQRPVQLTPSAEVITRVLLINGAAQARLADASLETPELIDAVSSDIWFWLVQFSMSPEMSKLWWQMANRSRSRSLWQWLRIPSTATKSRH
jgi:hypothetical protein